MKARFLSFLLLLNGFACFGAVPQIDVDLDFQAPLNEFTLHIAEGTSPTIRANLFDDGSAFTATGWTGVLYLQASWSASTVIAITNSAVNASSLDFAMTAAHTSTTGTWAANFILTETDSGDLMEWSRGKVIFRDSPGTSGATAISLLTALNWDQFTFSGTDPWTEDLPVIIAGSGIEVTTNGVNRTIATTGAGPGDMTKAVYDTGDNGKVDTADNSDALGGTAAASYATDAEVAAAYFPLSGGATLTGVNPSITYNSTQRLIFGASGTTAGQAWTFNSTSTHQDDISLSGTGGGESYDLWFDDGTSPERLYHDGTALSTGAGVQLYNWGTEKFVAARFPTAQRTHSLSFTAGDFAGPFASALVGYAALDSETLSTNSIFTAEAFGTSDSTQRSGTFRLSFRVPPDATAWVTTDAFVLAMQAENITTTNCKYDLAVYSHTSAFIGQSEEYAASNQAFTSATVPTIVGLDAADLGTIIPGGWYTVELTIYSANGYYAGPIAAQVEVIK